MFTFQPMFDLPIFVLLTISGLVGFGFLLSKKGKLNKKMLGVWVFRFTIFCLTLILMLRPSFTEHQEVEVFSNQFDVYFLVDVTGSMVAEDWEDGTELTRLNAVKKDISKIVDEYSGARYGLVTFGYGSKIVTPLTKDSTALMSSVKNLVPEITKNSQGSNPKVAADLLDKLLAGNVQQSPDRARVVFVFSDGEPTAKLSSGSPDFSGSGDKINGGAVLGYGSVSGGRMKVQTGYFVSLDEGTYVKNPDTGDDALSVLDEKVLNEIGSELGVPTILRSSDTVLQLPEVDNVVLVSNGVGMKVDTDYSWVVAVLIVVLVSVDLGLLLVRVRRVTTGGGV